MGLHLIFYFVLDILFVADLKFCPNKQRRFLNLVEPELPTSLIEKECINPNKHPIANG